MLAHLFYRKPFSFFEKTWRHDRLEGLNVVDGTFLMSVLPLRQNCENKVLLRSEGIWFFLIFKS